MAMATGSSPRVLCRLQYVAATPAHAQEIVALLASALRLPPHSSPTQQQQQQLHLGNAVLDVHALPPWVATARHSGLLNRPVLARLCGVEVFADPNAGPAAGRSPRRAGDDARAWLTEDRPVVTPTVGLASGAPSTPTPTTSPLVKEIVLGAGPRWHELTTTLEEDLHAAPLPQLPHMYALGNVNNNNYASPGIAVRLLPSIMSALVLQVEAGGMVRAKEGLWAKKVPFEEIGSTGAHEGQVLLSSPVLRGLDVRLCDSAVAISPFFNEGDEVLTEGVFKELNPALEKKVEGGNVPAAAYRREGTGLGDCWSEFRSQLRRPSGFFSSSSSR